MNRWTLPRVAAVAATCLLVTGGTAFAGSRIVMYTSSSNGNYDYSSVMEMNDAASDVNDTQDVDIPDFPETLGSYTFDGGNTVNVAGQDDAGNTLGKWNDLRAVYKNADGNSVYLSISPRVPDEDDRTPTETRAIDGIIVEYNYDEYLILPPDMDGSESALAPEIQERMETDDHFFVSYGSAEEETAFFSGVSFVKDNIHYYIFSMDEIDAEELFSTAGDLIER